MASSCKYFSEDAVYRVNKKGFVQIGLVLENSEFVSSDEDEDYDPDMSDEPMKRGYVRVAWHPRGIEEVLPEKKLKLYDRSLMPGDIVRRLVVGKDTQLGYCKETKVLADFQVVGCNKVIANIPSTDLISLEEFSASIAVYLDSWVGLVKSVNTEVTLFSKDGARCILQDKDAHLLDDFLDKRNYISEFKKETFYPGQKLWGSWHCYKNAKWLNMTSEMQSTLTKQGRSIWATVEEVNVASLKIQWLCRAFCEGGSIFSDVEQPPYQVEGDALKRVKMMHIFEPCALQTGDRNFYVIKEKEHIIPLEEWRKDLTEKIYPEGTGSKTRNVKDKPTVENGVNESDDSEYEDIDDKAEDEGNISDTSSVNSQSTTSSTSAKGGKKCKKGFTVVTNLKKKRRIRRARRKFLGPTPFQVKPGSRIVTETLTTKTNVVVIWQDGTVEDNISSESLYPVHHLDGHEFFPGEFIVENKDLPKPHVYGVVQSVDHIGRTAKITWMKTYLSGESPHPEVLNEEDVSVYDIKDHPDFRYRHGSCVIRVANFEDKDPQNTAGQVIDIHPNGMVEVCWVSGKISLCYPQELYRIFEYDSDSFWGDDDDSSSAEGSWETESENSVDDEFFDAEAGDVVNTIVDSTTPEVESISATSENQLPELLHEKFQEGLDNMEELLSANGLKLEPQSTENLGATAGDTARKEDDHDVRAKREKMMLTIEKMRTGLVRLEEMFSQNVRIHNSALLSQLLQIYKYCRLLDKVLGTVYFHEENVQVLVEQLRQRGRINSAQHMAEQITRFFGNLGVEPTDTTPTEEARGSAEQSVSLADASASVNSSESSSAYKQFFQLLKGRLLKVQEYLQQLYGLSRTTVSDAMMDSLESSPRHVSVGTLTEDKEEVQPQDEEKTEELGLDDEVINESTAGQGVFMLMDYVPDSHKYKLSIFQPTDSRHFFRTIRKELNLLKTSLPEGIIVKAFEDRMDLFSVLIKGPRRTPYEDGIFLFDFQLPADYPKVPPLCYYISYCSDRLNPNLYEGGKVCVSLLGTWGGKGTEVWNSASSNLLQIIVSIQGLILVSEPYYNEAGYERQRDTQLGKENSRMYNEMVVIKLMQAVSKMIASPPEIFREEVIDHFKQHASTLVWKLEKWLEISESWNVQHPASPTTPTAFRKQHFEISSSDASSTLLPEFPLLPASKGFCLTLRKNLVLFREVLESKGIPLELSS